MRKI
ncbi:Protein CBG25592 [Caenorhabditis briggsae]|jgi:serine/threonine protein kinase